MHTLELMYLANNIVQPTEHFNQRSTCILKSPTTIILKLFVHISLNALQHVASPFALEGCQRCRNYSALSTTCDEIRFKMAQFGLKSSALDALVYYTFLKCIM